MNKKFATDNLSMVVQTHEHRLDVLENIVSSSKEVLNMDEASAFMGISKSSIYKMTHKHELPFYRPNGKLIYFEKSELLCWMRQNRSMTDAETKDAATKHITELCK